MFGNMRHHDGAISRKVGGLRSKRAARGIGITLAVLLAGTSAYAATNWLVALSAGSSGEAQSASITNLTIVAVASPAATNQLYPGGNGDVVVTIGNTNPYPVTITAVQLPTNATFATGYSASNLTGVVAGCTSVTSDVAWNFSTGTSGSSHTLTTPLVVGANASLVTTFTNDASMTATTPLACAGIYFSMPSLTGISASGGAATATTSPTTDAWTS
jgi:hypothetical protein